MYISRATFRNFRNFQASTFSFKPGVNTLIGENGSGKSNALFGIRLLIDDSLNRRSTFLKESDFNRSLADWKGHWVVVSIQFSDLDASEGCQILRHQTGHMDDRQIGTATLFFRPRREVRRRLFELAQAEEADEVVAFLAAMTLDDYESVLTGRGTADFADDAQYRALAGDFDAQSFPDPDDEDTDALGVPIPSIHQEVTCTFVKALRDVVADLRGYRNNPLIGLLRGADSNIDIADETSLLATISRLNEQISDLDELRRITDGVRDTLSSTVGRTYSPDIAIESNVPSDMERLLRSLSLRVGDALDDGYRGNLDELGLGGANLIFLSLKLLEYQFKLSKDRVANFLLIEEPEAHLHSHLQMTLFERHHDKSTQVIVTTHSSHLSSASRISRMNILAKAQQRSLVLQPSNGLLSEQCHRIERYLDAVRSTLLFAKGVLLVEGYAELILIPALVKQALGVSVDELGISVVAMGSAVFEHIALLFHEDRIQRRCALLTDLDQSVVELPDEPDDDTEFERRCRNSQQAGAARKQNLDEFCESNDWLSVFYATHTLEVDFLGAGNSRAVLAVLPHLYSQPARIESSKKALLDSSSAVGGQEVLRLAAKHGKGWFALLLAEAIAADVVPTSHILDGLAFVLQDAAPSSVLRAIGDYRVEQGLVRFERPLDSADARRVLANEDFLARYAEMFPDDLLTRILS